MKNSKKLKLILIILICILISLVGIIGIYTKSSNMYKNLLPEYTLASDISETTIIEFKPDTSVEKVYYDKEGKKVDSSTITEENKKDYDLKEIPINPEENYNLFNYNESLKIMEKRLKLLEADEYRLDLDKKTGIISLTVEDNYIEDIESILPMESKLQLIDANTKDVILDYSDFTSAESNYASLTLEYITYITLKLNDSGIEKVNNFENYKTAEIVDEELEKNAILLMFDDEKISEISYDDILLNGKTLRVTTASGLTSETQINSQLNIDAIVCKLSTIGKMPLVYELSAEKLVKNDLGKYSNYIIISLSVLCVIISVVLIIKYRLNGVLAVLGFVSNVALFLIIIRLTNIKISLNCYAGAVGLILFNFYLINNILNSIKNVEKVFSENVKNAYKKTLDVIVVMLIIFIVFSFSRMTVISTMGLLLFWGWIVTILGTLTFTVPMLAITTKKQ